MRTWIDLLAAAGVGFYAGRAWMAFCVRWSLRNDPKLGEKITKKYGDRT